MYPQIYVHYNKLYLFEYTMTNSAIDGVEIKIIRQKTCILKYLLFVLFRLVYNYVNSGKI